MALRQCKVKAREDQPCMGSAEKNKLFLETGMIKTHYILLLDTEKGAKNAEVPNLSNNLSFCLQEGDINPGVSLSEERRRDVKDTSHLPP